MNEPNVTEQSEDARPQFAAATGSANTPKKPVDVAHEWLKNSRQEWNGHISTWTSEQMDNYHRDLGLLVDFVTECWPNVCMSEGADKR